MGELDFAFTLAMWLYFERGFTFPKKLWISQANEVHWNELSSYQREGYGIEDLQQQAFLSTYQQI